MIIIDATHKTALDITKYYMWGTTGSAIHFTTYVQDRTPGLLETRTFGGEFEFDSLAIADVAFEVIHRALKRNVQVLDLRAELAVALEESATRDRKAAKKQEWLDVILPSGQLAALVDLACETEYNGLTLAECCAATGVSTAYWSVEQTLARIIEDTTKCYVDEAEYWGGGPSITLVEAIRHNTVNQFGYHAEQEAFKAAVAKDS
jgi:hypothetical protein